MHLFLFIILNRIFRSNRFGHLRRVNIVAGILVWHPIGKKKMPGSEFYDDRGEEIDRPAGVRRRQRKQNELMGREKREGAAKLSSE